MLIRWLILLEVGFGCRLILFGWGCSGRLRVWFGFLGFGVCVIMCYLVFYGNFAAAVVAG